MIELVAIPEERLELLRGDDEWRTKFERLCDAKIKLNDEVELETENSLIMMRAKQVFVAFGRGFEFDDALNMLDEDFLIEIIDIKSFAISEKRREVLKGRIIGTGGKIRKLIEKNCNAKISVYGKTVCIMGKWDEVKVARHAVEMLLNGSKHSSMMRYIQENKNL